MKVEHGQNQPQGEDRHQSIQGIPDTIMTSRKEVLTPEDLAEVLGISVWTIYAKTSKRNRYQTKVDLPPFFRMGKLIRFWRRDLVSWLESRKKIDPNKP